MVQVSTGVFALVLTCIVYTIADDYDINLEYDDDTIDDVPPQKRFDHFFNQRARDRYLIEQSQSPSRRDQPTYKVKRFYFLLSTTF